MPIGLWLGAIISILILVICVPNFVMCFAHWKCVTRDGSKYTVKWTISFAAYLVAVFIFSVGIMLGMRPKRLGMTTKSIQAMIFAVVVPIIILFACHCVHWSSPNVGLRILCNGKLGLRWFRRAWFLSA